VQADFESLQAEHEISLRTNKANADRIAYLESQLQKSDDAVKECEDLRKENK
jgi:hypothetical protein